VAEYFGLSPVPAWAEAAIPQALELCFYYFASLHYKRQIGLRVTQSRQILV
jgi:hypothetical protein